MKQPARTLQGIQYEKIAVGVTGLVLFMAMTLGTAVLVPLLFEDAEKKAISVAGAGYYMQVMRKCPSLEPQARAMMADHDADRAEIRRMNAYVATAKSIVGERRCDVDPVDLDRRDSSTPVF